MTHFAGVATEKPNSFDTGDVGVDAADRSAATNRPRLRHGRKEPFDGP